MADIIISLFLFLALSQNQRHLHTPNRTEDHVANSFVASEKAINSLDIATGFLFNWLVLQKPQIKQKKPNLSSWLIKVSISRRQNKLEVSPGPLPPIQLV